MGKTISELKRREKKLKREFAVRYFFKYFLYGHLFFLGILMSLALGLFIVYKVNFPWNLISVLCLIPAGICLNHYVRILSRTKFKWKFYKVYSYRLAKKPFDEDWFSIHMYEPCMRLIIKDLCKRYGYQNEYLSMYNKYAHENVYLEMKKQEIIDQVKMKYESMS